MTQADTAKAAVLTGASSGIGWALAKELAKEGYRMGLVARRGDALARLTAEIRDLGGYAEFAVADVADRQATLDAIGGLEAKIGTVELLVANAGMGVPTQIDPMNVPETEQMFRVNMFGLMYAIEAVLPGMLQRGRGHLAGVSSLAAYKGFPGQAGYCGSKAAVKTYLESLRLQLRDRHIHVTCICPGFVKTQMTEGHGFRMPFLMDADEAARRVARALRRKKKVFSFPWQTERLVKLCYWVPDRILLRVLRGTY